MDKEPFIVRWRVLRHVKELAIIAGAYFVYMFIRKFLVPNIEPAAFEHAVRVVDFELSAGFLWEAAWQSWAIESAKALVIILNWAYIITFWPILITTGLILYVVNRGKYAYFRNIVLLSFVLALILYASFPLAPPRYLPEYGFVDTIQKFGPTWYGGREMHVYYNAFAAMPSLHFGWTVLFGVLFLSMKSKWIKPLGIIYPAMTFFAITITGNHYIIDAVGGALVISASFGLYWLIRKVRANPPPLLTRARPTLARTGVKLNMSFQQWGPGVRAGLANLASYVLPSRSPSRNHKLAFASDPFGNHRKGFQRRSIQIDRILADEPLLNDI